MGYLFKGRQLNNETEWRLNIYSGKEMDARPRHGGSVENKVFRKGCWEKQLLTQQKMSPLPHTTCKINLKWTTDPDVKWKVGNI